MAGAWRLFSLSLYVLPASFKAGVTHAAAGGAGRHRRAAKHFSPPSSARPDTLALPVGGDQPAGASAATRRYPRTQPRGAGDAAALPQNAFSSWSPRLGGRAGRRSLPVDLLGDVMLGGRGEQRRRGCSGCSPPLNKHPGRVRHPGKERGEEPLGCVPQLRAAQRPHEHWQLLSRPWHRAKSTSEQGTHV